MQTVRECKSVEASGNNSSENANNSRQDQSYFKYD